MRKEQVIAVILGSFIGIGVAFGIWRLSRASEEKNSSSPQTQDNNNQIETKPTNGKLSIVAPADNAVAVSSSITVSGLTRPNSPVAVSANKIYTKEATGTGEFSIEVELTPGFNNIVVWSFEKGKVPEKEELTLIHTDKIDDSSAAMQASLGTVTDIAEDSLQIRTKDGDIVQLSLTDATTYGSIIEEATKEVKFTDLAIGDFVAALGTQNREGVFEIRRILITTEPAKAEVTAVVGIVDTLSAKEFIVLPAEGEEVSVDATGTVSTFAKGNDGLSSTRLSTAEAGEAIVIIGTFKDKELVASTIILL
ncbi:hypothetical protein A2803_01795 [Candidatus Woesebacteria bacterium RIFCSPHIGHO2_01_FULL_44_21]|uniref:DUF5666 domain-containing protein n=1 Tax=Candidatus Woesebacteria bacterium RIFCSPHIGHO2_01_FULL_44_21 TaxID=1802503 RepID=A0A1F7YWW1_9BACT|nr:MAG: hypothetical protein A2803_01795 [Candidatus Woesebacteria bacterium RIFCSPHIGHO2_01_FULL_44_21]OGM69605.1 MAG: hypothetical protein A2897_03310 [Candidatus Woesebacteria bacterium RIFCSPLOWO2_01_FULL_44_24b]